MTSAWENMEHIFAIRRSSEQLPPRTTNAKVITKFPSIHSSILPKHQMDLLVVEYCSRTRSKNNDSPEAWETAIAEANAKSKPKVVLESWNARCNTWSHGPTATGCNTRWSKMGYETRVKFVSCTDVGGALEQFRILIARVQKCHASKWVWPSIPEATPRRPMANLLSPPGFISKTKYLSSTSPYDIVSDASSDPMPPHTGNLIRTEQGI